jgi:hypothetical protein
MIIFRCKIISGWRGHNLDGVSWLLPIYRDEFIDHLILPSLREELYSWYLQPRKGGVEEMAKLGSFPEAW